jgi:hypothetical protein
MNDRKYIVYEMSKEKGKYDLFIVKRFTTLSMAYRYWMADPSKRTLTKVIDVEIREK